MKRTHFLLFCSVAFALLTVVACQKTYNKDNPSTPTTNVNPATGPISLTKATSLNELFKDFRSTPEKKCVTAGIAQEVTFGKGTRLTFYPSSFKNAAGSTITSGEVCLEIVEMYKPGDMIANRASTMTKDKNILISGGQVYINATMNGKEVFANTYGIAFPQPAPSTQPMGLFYGDRNNSDSLVEWTVAPPGNGGTTAERTIADTSTTRYIFDSSTMFNGVNVDRIYTNAGPTTNNFRVVMPDTSYNKYTTQIFLVHPKINAVTSAYYYDPSILSFRTSNGSLGYPLPIGNELHVIVMAVKNGDFYYWEQKGLKVEDGTEVKTAPTKMSKDEIIAKLATL